MATRLARLNKDTEIAATKTTALQPSETTATLGTGRVPPTVTITIATRHDLSTTINNMAIISPTTSVAPITTTEIATMVLTMDHPANEMPEVITRITGAIMTNDGTAPHRTTQKQLRTKECECSTTSHKASPTSSCA